MRRALRGAGSASRALCLAILQATALALLAVGTLQLYSPTCKLAKQELPRRHDCVARGASISRLARPVAAGLACSSFLLGLACAGRNIARAVRTRPAQGVCAALRLTRRGWWTRSREEARLSIWLDLWN